MNRMLLFLLVLFLFLVTGKSPWAQDESFGPASLQNAATVTGAGTFVVTSGWNKKTVTVQITGTATVLVQGSLDSSYWETITSVNATGTVTFDTAWRFTRANITVCTGCTVTATAYLQAR